MEDELKPGDLVAGKLEVIRKIAGGGMGAVYEVEHRLTRHRRALKILHKSQSMNQRYVERLLREASVAGRLDTPYVVETLDAGTLDNGAPYLLMELLHGDSLLDLMEREAPMESARAVRVIRQVCEGMAAAHAAGIVHRDLKPENVILTSTEERAERVKIIDFGISHFKDAEEGDVVTRLTTEGTIIGTPYYMSPEQASGEDVDARADVYALGILLYEALTGRLPFIADTTAALFVKIGTGEYLPLRHRRRDLVPELADLVERAFHRDPNQRFASAKELADALGPFAKPGQGQKEKPRRATQDYESDPPRARTSQGVAPPAGDLAATMDVEHVPAFADPIAVRGGEPVPRAPASPTPVSPIDAPASQVDAPASLTDAPAVARDAPTEEVALADATPSPVIPPTQETLGPRHGGQRRIPTETDDEDFDSDPPKAAGMPAWVGTTALAALIAAIVAVAVVGATSFGGAEDERSAPSPVVSTVDRPEPTTTEIIEVTEPALAEMPEMPETPEALRSGDELGTVETPPTNPSDSSRRTMGPSSMMRAVMNSAPPLETDPYGP